MKPTNEELKERVASFKERLALFKEIEELEAAMPDADASRRRAQQTLAQVHYRLITIRAHCGDGINDKQVSGVVSDALEDVEHVWRELGYHNPDGYPDVGTQITDHVDELFRERFNREYGMFSDDDETSSAVAVG
jgi:hypothetical protein